MLAHIWKLFPLAVLVATGCSGQPPDAAPPTLHVDAQPVEPERVTAEVTADPMVQTVESRIPPPPGFLRIPVAPESFGEWLRALPLREGRPPVYLFDGHEKADQTVHYAVLDTDVGEKDLQQCADAVIRLRAEYLFSGPCSDEIQFNFTSGDTARWKDWREGIRPIVSGNRVSWKSTAEVDDRYANFRAYLDTVFTYAGSASLERELNTVADPAKLELGDVFIAGGYPGHAVLVIDVVENATGGRAFLLAQSYMPAQDIHILRSFEDIDPWYRARPGGLLRTPEWDFDYGDLKRFPRTSCEAGSDNDNRMP